MIFMWNCPACGATEKEHGERKCKMPIKGGGCSGFKCLCTNKEDELHGMSIKTTCFEAVCYHCGWKGAFPNIHSISRIEEFLELIKDLKSVSNQKNFRVILYEWIQECTDIFIDDIDDETVVNEFGAHILEPVWTFLSLLQKKH